MIDDTTGDDALFERWLDGDEAAFRTVFARLAPIVLRFAQKRGLDEAEASDAVQQTFLAVHRARGDFRRGARLRPWLFTIASNVIRQEQRWRMRRREVELDAELDVDRFHAGSPDEARFDEISEQARDAAVQCLHDALARLPPGQREVIELHWLYGLPFVRVAERVGSTDGAVRVRAHRGYEKLRAWLTDATGRAGA